MNSFKFAISGVSIAGLFLVQGIFLTAAAWTNIPAAIISRSSNGCVINRTLALGMNGSDVSCLQRLLAQDTRFIPKDS